MLSCGNAMIWLSGMPAQLLIASFFPIAAAINGTKQKALLEMLETFGLRMYVACEIQYHSSSLVCANKLHVTSEAVQSIHWVAFSTHRIHGSVHILVMVEKYASGGFGSVDGDYHS